VSGTLATAGVTQPLPVGLGFRVPLLLISPWTRGGWVTSEVSDHTSVIQFMENWTTAIGTPAICPNISSWRRSVCGDLTSAFDFANPVFGLPDLPVPGPPIGDPPGGSYHPVPVTNQMPPQEPGTRPARPLPYQPNAYLTGFTAGGGGADIANLLFSNSAPHARKASHFSVYNNMSPDVNFLDYPAGFPGQYTVEPSHQRGQSVPGSAEIGAGHGNGSYDLTIVGPNRFLRRFTGDVSAPGATARVTVAYYQGGWGPRPQLVLTLANGRAEGTTFTVTQNNYSTDATAIFDVPAGGAATYTADPVTSSSGWYDVTVTISSDASWSQRFTGHLETGTNSISGS
jgi:phospholipase C